MVYVQPPVGLQRYEHSEACNTTYWSENFCVICFLQLGKASSHQSRFVLGNVALGISFLFKYAFFRDLMRPLRQSDFLSHYHFWLDSEPRRQGLVATAGCGRRYKPLGSSSVPEDQATLSPQR